MNRISVIITFEAKPENAAAVAAVMAQVKRNLPAVHGCNKVRLFGSSDNPCIFTLLEEWESEGHHQAHINVVVASGAWDSIALHLASAPVSHYYKEL